MNDPIVEEIRRIRDAHAARFQNDLDAIFRDIKEREKAGGFIFVRGAARRPTSGPAVEPACPAPVPADPTA
jgi:hypothetical protein